MSSWKEVWDRREFQGRAPSNLDERIAQSLILDGFDSQNRSGLTPESLHEFTMDWLKSINFHSDESVYEVGCGTGAFLASVGKSTDFKGKLSGSDYSLNMIQSGEKLFSEIDFAHLEADSINNLNSFDHLVSFGVFLYFPSKEYALKVINRMIACAGKSVSILDIPDLSKIEESEMFRETSVGSETYRKEYSNLKHLYFEKHEFLRAFPEDIWDVKITNQDIPGYENSNYRFNVVAIRR